MEAPADRVLEITRIVDAPRALVFRAWTDPAHLARWWGPLGFVTTELLADIRVGGAYRACMRSPTGTTHCRRGVYREIVAPERLVFTYAWEDARGALGPETIVTVTFAELGAKTRLSLRQAVFETSSACDSHREGWMSCLERFADYVATLTEEIRP
jgi:uncharacterized protein YndB with AHSA1/START domain